MNMRKTKTARLREQRERQQAYRERIKAERRPSRDDIARVALRWVISETYSNMNERQVGFFEARMLSELALQGFDVKACEEALSELVEKYTEGHWQFRLKRHLDTHTFDTSGDGNA